MRHFIEWDSFEVRVDGERIAAMAREMIAGDPMLERLDLQFTSYGRQPRSYYPTIRQLYLEKDLTGLPASFLVKEGRITSG